MTKIDKNKQKKNVHSHIKDALIIIEKYLPYSYSKDALAKCETLKIETTIEDILKIKNGRGNQDLNYNIILNVLVEMALQNKKQILLLKSNTIDN